MIGSDKNVNENSKSLNGHQNTIKNKCVCKMTKSDIFHSTIFEACYVFSL